jgi:hypothetical protein
MKNTPLLRSYGRWLLAGLITITIGIQIRLYPLTHNVASDAYEQGTLLVISKIRAMVAAQVNAQNPNMSPAQRSALINSGVNEILKKDKVKAREAFDRAGKEILKNSPDSKYYLQEADSYYFLDLTRNILERGDVSPRVQGSRYFNSLMLAPLGYWEPQTWHPYIGAFIYKIIHLFSPDTDLMTAVSWTPIIIFPFIVAAFFFACRSLGVTVLPSFIASVFFVLTPSFIQHSAFAWYKNSIYNIFFPVLVIGLLISAVRNIDQKKKALLFSALCAGAVSLYSMFWPGWGFVLALSVISLVLIAIQALFLKRRHAGSVLLTGSLLLCLCSLAVGFLYTWPLVLVSVREAWGELMKFTTPQMNGWPDLFIVVGELKHPTPSNVIELSGGPLIFAGAMLTILLKLLSCLRKKALPSYEFIVLCVFLASTGFLAFNTQRFSILFLSPLALTFAWGLEELWRKKDILVRFGQSARLPAPVVKTGFALILLSSLLLPIVTSQKMIRSLISPIFNSTWERALTRLRDRSPGNSVINTWWSPGHFVKAIARRQVTFDGASIKGEQGYWLTKAYMARSEREALGTLRMLNTSSNKACEYLTQLGLPLSKAVPLLSHLTALSRVQARKKLLNVFPPQKVDELLSLTHGVPPPSYVLIYQEIIDSNVLLSYVGKWDFEKIETLNNTPAKDRKIPPKSSPAYVDFLWRLVGGPLRQSRALNAVSQKDHAVLFEDGVLIDTLTKDTRIDSPQFGRGIPKSIVYYDDATGKITEKNFNNSTLGYSVIYYKEENIPKVMLMDPDLANSLIVKMYYFEGKGLKYFNPFSKERDLTGRTKIFIYEVAWPEEFMAKDTP